MLLRIGSRDELVEKARSELETLLLSGMTLYELCDTSSDDDDESIISTIVKKNVVESIQTKVKSRLPGVIEKWNEDLSDHEAELLDDVAEEQFEDDTKFDDDNDWGDEQSYDEENMLPSKYEPASSDSGDENFVEPVADISTSSRNSRTSKISLTGPSHTFAQASQFTATEDTQLSPIEYPPSMEVVYVSQRNSRPCSSNDVYIPSIDPLTNHRTKALTRSSQVTVPLQLSAPKKQTKKQTKRQIMEETDDEADVFSWTKDKKKKAKRGN